MSKIIKQEKMKKPPLNQFERGLIEHFCIYCLQQNLTHEDYDNNFFHEREIYVHHLLCDSLINLQHQTMRILDLCNIDMKPNIILNYMRGCIQKQIYKDILFIDKSMSNLIELRYNEFMEENYLMYVNNFKDVMEKHGKQFFTRVIN